MSFAHPHLFFLLSIPLLLGIWEWRHRTRASTAAAPKIILGEAKNAGVTLGPARKRSRRGPSIRLRLLLGLTLTIVALARPQWGRIDEPVFDQSREILIAIDLSRSMLASDVKPTRLDRAKLLVQSLLERLAGERVGLLVFSGTAFLQIPLSADYEILREFLPALDPNYLPEGGSNYRAMLETALSSFSADGGADRFLIVLSDGEATDDTWLELVENLKAKAIRAIGLGIGTAEGSMIPDSSGGFVKDDRGAVVLSRLGSDTLRDLAEKTDGVYTDASSWIDLAALIQNTVEKGAKGEFREASRIRLAERFQWALAPGLFLLAWSFLKEFPVRPRPRDLTLTPSPL